MTKLFISYRSLDSAKVDALVARLRSLKRNDGTARFTIWQDKTGIPDGHDWWESIVDALIDCDVVVFMVSRNSVNNVNCRAELSYARKRNRPVLPLVLDGEFSYNPVTGKNDIDYWKDIPQELNDLRAQFLFYEGTSFVPRLEAAVNNFENNPQSWHDFPAPRPRDPRDASDESNNTTALYDEACDYAWRFEIATAERLFLKLVNLNDPDFAGESREWMLLLREYQKLASWDARESTRHKMRDGWVRYSQLFPKPFIEGIYDPKDLQSHLNNKPSAVPPVAVTNAPQTPGVVVAKVGPADYRTINDALKKAPDGATIRVQPGLYRESLNLTRPVEIIGDGKRDDIIIESDNADCIFMATDYAVVRGLTLRLHVGNTDKKYFGVDIPGGRLVLENCDITSDSLACIGIHNPQADPVIRACRIHNGKQGGVYVYENGAGLIEDCEIWGNGLTGVQIKSGANPIVRTCRIHDGKEAGVFVYENGAGLIEDCEIWGNASVGVAIKEGGNPIVRYCQINKNGYEAIWSFKNGRGAVENCDMRDNGGKGAFDIDATSTVTQRNNKEK